MKKISAFFLALLPIFVVVLMFISGLIVKNITFVPVSSVELTETSIEQRKPDNNNPTHQLVANVLPLNATNPGVRYVSSDENILKVDNDGEVTCVGFGDAYVYAISKENETLNASCKFHVWDNKIHNIIIENIAATGYMSVDQKLSMIIKPVPAEGAEQDPITFESDKPDIVEVLPNGELIAKQKNLTDQDPVKITLTPKSEFTKKEVNVRVGDGVNAIAFNEPNEIIIKESQINLFDQLSVFPEKKENLKPELFTFTSKNPDIATSDDKGNVTFKQAGSATFEVMFVPSGATATKKITSTYSFFSDVSFSRFQSTIDFSKLDKDKHASKKDVSLNVYPYSVDASNLTITSSDEKVVSYDPNYTGENSKFVINGAGNAILTATITLPNGSTKQDTCNIYVKDSSKPESYVLNPEVSVNPNYTYYYLRENINTNKLENKYQTIKWSIPNSEEQKIAFIDSDDQKDIEFIHFKTTGTVTVQGKLTETTSFNFKVKCNAFPQPKVVSTNIDSLAAITLEAGKPYILTHTRDGVTYDVCIKNDDATANQTFIQTKNESGRYLIIPKHGFHIREYDLYKSPDAQTIDCNVNIDVIENPVAFRFDENQKTYITSQKKMLMQEDASIGVIPFTAKQEKSDRYKIAFEYEFSHDDATVNKETDEITFLREGLVNVTAKAGNLQQKFTIKSTYGTLGKFALTDGEKIIQSGDTISLPAQGEKVLCLASSLSGDLIEPSFKVEHMTDADAVKCVTHFDKDTKLLTFALSANQNKFGLDILKISSGNYFFYLTVTAPAVVQGFDLYYHNDKLAKSDDAIITHTNNLKFFVAANPLQATESLTFDAELINPSGQKEQLTPGPNNTLTIADKFKQQDAVYQLVLSTKDKKITNTFKFKYNEAVSSLDIDEADEKNSIYIDCGSTSKVLTILADGLVDDDFFNRNFRDGTFKFSLNNKTSEDVVIIGNKIVIKGMPSPSETTYSTTCSLEINDKNIIKKDYSLTREIVSRIVLPGHDNTDINDLKGLQKVHVFGNKSMYSPQEGMLDYYKLPITLYDYQGNPIEDTDNNPLKEQAFNTLIVGADSHATFKYHKMDANNPKGFVEVHFSQDPNSVYTANEIYNDKFVDKVKDAKFTISDHISAASHIKKAFAQYQFVPVNGVNAYCEQALDCKNTNNYNVVLQTNFGLPDKTMDNMPFTNPDAGVFHDIYGNGYTINFNARAKANEGKDPSKFDIEISKMFNTTLQGSNKEQLAKSQTRIRAMPSSSDGCFYEYNTITNVFHGMAFWKMGTLSHEAHLRKNMFYDNKLVSVHIDGLDDPDNLVPNVYLEDCVFFNCSAAAISFANNGYLYFKGDISVYNFQNQQMLDLSGYPGWGGDYRVFWDQLIDDEHIVKSNVIQKNAAGEKNINSNMFAIGNANDNVSFWNGQEYVKSKKGTAQTCPYLKNFFYLNLYVIAIGLWATEAVPGAPSYYDEFDMEGKIRLDFMSKQVQKIVRVIPPVFLKYPRLFS